MRYAFQNELGVSKVSHKLFRLRSAGYAVLFSKVALHWRTVLDAVQEAAAALHLAFNRECSVQ